MLFAQAIVHGHLWIDWPGRIIDAAAWNGQHYVIDGPFPVLFLLPLVGVWGVAANQTSVAIAGAVLATALAWTLLRRLGVDRAPRLWLVLFFFAGTDLWWCAEIGDTQFLAHIAAVCCTLGALIELFGKQRGWIVGLCAVAAVESRFPMVMALPLYACSLYRGGRWMPTMAYAACLAGGLAFWVALNEAQWGLPYDIGHDLFFHQDPYGAPSGSPFALRFLPYQLYSYFMRAPDFVQWGMQETKWPYLVCTPNGVALTFTSPALALAFWARRRIAWALWATVVLVAGPGMLYYVNGWYQVGMRHALDFEPFLLALMAFACAKGMPRWGALLIAWSVTFGCWQVWYWGVFFRTGN